MVSQTCKRFYTRVQWRSQRVAIGPLSTNPEFNARDRKILIPMHVRRLIKYLKVEEYIRVIVQRKRASFPIS
jgi:hypothetical protein